MKRLALIVGIALCAALGIGAFVVSGSDGNSEAKAPTTTQKANPAKDAAKTISGASNNTKVQSLPPVPSKNDDKDDDKNGKGEAEGYEAKKAFVAVSPSKAKPGEKIEIEIKGFDKNKSVTVTLNGVTSTVKTDKNGKAKVKGVAPASPSIYPVTVAGPVSGQPTTLSAKLTVVAKK